MRLWFYVKDETQHGPVAETTLPSLFLTGVLSADTLVWTEGMQEWALARNIPDLVPKSLCPPPPPSDELAPHTDLCSVDQINNNAPLRTDGHSAQSQSLFSLPTAQPLPGESFSIELQAGCDLQFHWIPPGECLTGSPSGERGRFKRPLIFFGDQRFLEEPQERFRLEKGFWMGKHMVTRAQWNALMNEKQNVDPPFTPQCPATRLLFKDISTCIQMLNSRYPGILFRLPSSSEWEYACRAGTTSRYYTGDTEADMKRAGWDNWTSRDCNELANFAKFLIAGNSAMRQPHLLDVGRREPNAWGLHDMHGLCWEVCSDTGRYKGLFINEFVSDEPVHVIRGGSYLDAREACRSASRSVVRDSQACPNVSFRLVCAV